MIVRFSRLAFLIRKQFENSKIWKAHLSLNESSQQSQRPLLKERSCVRVLKSDQDKQANEDKICIVKLNQNQKAWDQKTRNIQQRSRRFMNLDLQNARERDLEDLMNLQNLEDSTNLQNFEIWSISKIDELSETSERIIKCWDSNIERRDNYIKNVCGRRIASLFNWEL
jgi:hypothetical protein